METAEQRNESTEEVSAVSMSPSTSLLACPFCGESEVEERMVTVHIAGEKPERYSVESGAARCVYCWNCGANALVQWWSRRHANVEPHGRRDSDVACRRLVGADQ